MAGRAVGRLEQSGTYSRAVGIWQEYEKTLAPRTRIWPWSTHLFADGGYDRTKLMDKVACLDFTVEIFWRIDAKPGFKVVPRRWVVERTFGWLTRWRRLVRDFERRIDVSGGMMLIAMSNLLLRRVCH